MAVTKITEISVCLAKLYFAVLLEHVRTELGKAEADRDITIRYGELVRRTKEKYPDAPYIEAAIPVNIGKRLLVVEMICQRLSLPNLACLAVNGQGRPGEGYTGDWEADKAAILAFDWDAASADVHHAFELETAAARKRARTERRRKLPESEARDLYWEAYKADRASYDGKVDLEGKEAMIKLLMRGFPIEEAFNEVVEQE
ncbi:hypothetical protein [Noviherbaspirillum pedocola]|uniref:Uncharacterized protein n=1 Tax=Noviherbaspirillum pedocola TaxID=2801341 RepID=A0A934W6K8_9BURK|nr:hypothetical protein [Noviherbaspirillum pedocola]MBK4735235.1 hypothetical protein [Noviherbaspirillum pedocola]